MTEKILSHHVQEGTLKRGTEVGIRIDHCLTQDSTGTMAWLEFESLGMKKVQAELVVSYSDHTSLGFKGESTDDHIFLQTIASHYGAKFSKNGNGVCHQLHYERFGVPGKTLLGSDSHTPTAGGLGMLGIGAGGMDVAVAAGGGLFHLVVPKMLNVILTGKLTHGVGAKDVALEILRRISVKGGVGHFIEFTGPGVKTLSVPERATITNMCTETGATSSIFPSDEVTASFLKMQNRESAWSELAPDDDAVYDSTLEVDLSSVKPLVAMPGMPDNVYDIEEVAGTKINQVYIGSCTNGSYHDLKIVAEMLKGKHVSTDIDVIVSPGSRQAWEMLMEDGSFLSFTKAGVRMIEPGCNACIGIGFVPGNGHLSLRTVNRNWKGRGGNKFGKIALCSPQVAAASALAGVIADPRELPQVRADGHGLAQHRDARHRITLPKPGKCFVVCYHRAEQVGHAEGVIARRGVRWQEDALERIAFFKGWLPGGNSDKVNAVGTGMGGAKVAQVDRVKVVLAHPAAQGGQILAPVNVGIHQVTRTALRAAGQLVKVGQVVRVDAQGAKNVPGYQKSEYCISQIADCSG